MVTVYQTRCFMGGKPMNKYLGSFFSVQSAEQKLGWYFFHDCCEAVPF